MEDLHAAVEVRLRRSRQRYTHGRRRLIELLRGAGRPLTIPEILGRGKDLAQSSVYRNLQVLEQAGAVRRILTASDAGARFELAEDLSNHHHHLICSSCGTVEDFRASRPVEQVFERLVADVSRTRRFSTDHHRLDLVGVCSDCR